MPGGTWEQGEQTVSNSSLQVALAQPSTQVAHGRNTVSATLVQAETRTRPGAQAEQLRQWHSDASTPA
jgi:hypothetical protein